MATIIWDKQYEFGVDQIDSQHLHLCELFNAINQSMENGEGVKIYTSAVDDMLDYAAKHFKVEEDLMLTANFSGLKDHLVEHAEFFKQANEFKLKANDKREIYETIKLVNFLWDWFLNHIQKTDRLYLPIIK